MSSVQRGDRGAARSPGAGFQMSHVCWELNHMCVGFSERLASTQLSHLSSPIATTFTDELAPVFMWHILLNITRAFYVDTDLNSIDYNFKSQIPPLHFHKDSQQPIN